MGNKSKRKKIIIPQFGEMKIHLGPEFEKNTQLRINISKMQEQLLAYKNQVDNFNGQSKEILEACRKDFFIISNLSNYRSLEIKIQQLLEKKESLFTPHPFTASIAELTTLNEQLEPLFLAIEDLNHKKIELKAKILERQEALCAQARTSQGLTKELTKEIIKSKKTLEVFFMIFGGIDFSDRTDQDLEFFKNHFKTFFEIIVKDMEAMSFAFNFKPLPAFHKFLLEKINTKEKNVEALSSSTIINNFIIELFEKSDNKETKATKEVIQNRIIQLRSFNKKVAAFPLKKLNNYHSLKQSSVEQDTLIHNQYNEIELNVTNLITTLETNLKLFTPLHKENHCLLHTRCMLARLGEYRRHLQERFSNFEKTKRELASDNTPIENLLNSLDKITVLQDAYGNALKEKNQHLNQSLKKDALSQNKLLIDFYLRCRNKLFSKLEKAIATCNRALRCCYSTKEIHDRLHLHLKKLTQLKDTDLNENLSILTHEVQSELDQLDNYVNEAKIKLEKNWKERIKALQHILTLRPLPKLNPTNPYFDVLNMRHLIMQQSITLTANTFNNIKSIRARKLFKTSQVIDRRYESALTQIDTYETYQAYAKIVEARLNSDAYKVALKVINTIQDEYKRILNDRDISAKAIATYPSDQEAIQRIQAEPPSELNEKVTHLFDKIDCRLTKLFRLQKQFEQVNQTFTQQKFDIQEPVLYENYKKALLEKVENELNNSHMEDYSEGVNTWFVQWLRKRVLWPLQKAAHVVAEAITNTPNRFFSIPFGCETENNLIEAGIAAYTNLASPAA